MYEYRDPQKMKRLTAQLDEGRLSHRILEWTLAIGFGLAMALVLVEGLSR